MENSIFNATQQDIENLLAAQCHMGSKNLQVWSSLRSEREARFCGN